LYEDTLEIAFNRLNLDSCDIIYDEILTDDPASRLSDWEEMYLYRIFMSNTNGHRQGTDVEFYASEEACDDALEEYADEYSDSEIGGDYIYGAYVVCWRAEGIRNHFARFSNHGDMLMVLNHSESRGLMDGYINWPNAPDEGEGPAFTSIQS
jgi:hypothetical protein